MGAVNITYQRTLIEACRAVGGEVELAARMGHPLGTVLDWLLGYEEAPVNVFLKSVDIVLASNRNHIADTEAFLQEVMRRNQLSIRKPR
jgi:hypothetical protein